MRSEEPGVTRTRLLLAFAAIYVLWGSTYLAIRLAIDTLPPFLMAGSRFLVAEPPSMPTAPAPADRLSRLGTGGTQPSRRCLYSSWGTAE